MATHLCIKEGSGYGSVGGGSSVIESVLEEAMCLWVQQVLIICFLSSVNFKNPM